MRVWFQMKTLYITYDGISDFVSRSQVIPYLEKLSRLGHEITVLSFEKSRPGEKEEAVRYRDYLSAAGISWIAKRYHRRPSVPATLFDVFQGITSGAGVIRRKNITALHARGYVPALIAFTLKLVFGTAVIFDMRGFWADEKVDAGSWKKNGLVYRAVKGMERYFLKNSDEIVVLAESARQMILKTGITRSPITVIPCCVDLSVFSPKRSEPVETQSSGRFVILYAGNLGTFYNLDKIFEFFSFVKKRNRTAFLNIASAYSRADIEKTASLYGVSDYSVKKLEHEEMPRAFLSSSVSVVFYNRELSGGGCSPIKLAESLACGVPVVINSGIGDSSDIVKNIGVGAVIEDFNEKSYSEAMDKIEELMRSKEETVARCVETAKKYFSIDAGVGRYGDIYRRIQERLK